LFVVIKAKNLNRIYSNLHFTYNRPIKSKNKRIKQFRKTRFNRKFKKSVISTLAFYSDLKRSGWSWYRMSKDHFFKARITRGYTLWNWRKPLSISFVQKFPKFIQNSWTIRPDKRIPSQYDPLFHPRFIFQKYNKFD